MMNNELYSPKETAKILGVHVRFHVLDEEIGDKSNYEELVDDLLSIVTSFSGKLYGIRSGKNKILKDKVEVAIQDVTNLSDEDQNR